MGESKDDMCDFSQGGPCCNGPGQEPIGTKDYCEALKLEGRCHSSSCFPLTMKPSKGTFYCCRNPKGPHPFHPPLKATRSEQPALPAVEETEEQPVTKKTEKSLLSKSVESADWSAASAESKDDMCDFSQGGPC